MEFGMSSGFFYWNGLEFDISNPNVYPPKPASLLLAECAVKIVKSGDRVLDVCTGCGIVAVAIAKFVPKAVVFASDINYEAIISAHQNAERNGVKIATVLTDLYDSFLNNKLDVITAHPPAVPCPPHKNWRTTLGMSIAINGGSDGLALVSRSIMEATTCLNKNGKLLLVLPHWCNFKKAYNLLRKNYSSISEIVRQKVEFFPATEFKPEKSVINYAYELAKKGVIEIEFKNNVPYSVVSVVQAIK